MSKKLGKVGPDRYCQTREGSVINEILAATGLIKDKNEKSLEPQTAVDIGAGNGSLLSNTRHLEEDFGWKRYMFDAQGRGNSNVIQCWITRDNIGTLLQEAKVPLNCTLISLDLDGNDYWIWKSILKQYKPRIICTEVNNKFSPTEPYTLVYNKDHVWRNKDLHYGASWLAFNNLFKRHGYHYIRCTPDRDNVLNCFWCLNELITPKVREMTEKGPNRCLIAGRIQLSGNPKLQRTD